jgi:hypothetical protein
MADDIQVEAGRLKARMQEMLRRVPPSVLNGNHGTAVDYKKVAGQAHKLLAASAPKFAALQQTFNQLSVFH